ncbi:MAG: hypothetical protein R3B45_07375 [Bdellovibrionota bacterium]
MDKIAPLNSQVLNEDEISAIEKSLNTKFSLWLKERIFELTTSSLSDAVHVVLTLKNALMTYHYPVEARLMHKEQNVSKKEASLFLIDYIDAYFDEYFREDEQVYLPIDWKDFEYEGISFQIKGQILNSYMEKLADRILAGEHVSDHEVYVTRPH